MYRLQVKPEVQKVVEKLAKKDKKQVEIILRNDKNITSNFQFGNCSRVPFPQIIILATKTLDIIFESFLSKVNEILQDPHRYKNLRSPLNYWKRVHIDSHFVLIFSVDEKEKIVILEYYGHHNEVY